MHSATLLTWVPTALRPLKLQVYAELTRGTAWSCEWSGVDAAVGAEPTVVDGHAHSLVIQCRVPAAVLSAVRHDGRFESTVKLVASKPSKNGGTGSGVVFALSDVPVCGSPIAARDQVVDLAACTMVSEIDPRFNPAVLTRQWVDWHLKNGLDHITVYVDADKREIPPGLSPVELEPPPLEVQIATALADLVDRDIVRIVYFHVRKRGAYVSFVERETF
eukprot:m.317095 g.317095  ORF g.317095 m.317095 type:complete len:219 (-) comp27554_c0_seq6:77-733(-)